MILRFCWCFLRGFWEKGGFGCGVLLVWLWWIAGISVVFRRVFLGAEKYASFLGFIFLHRSLQRSL
jgi:hypothetical protein